MGRDEVDDEGSYAPVDGLPDELLLVIFSLLPAADLVVGVRGACRRWRALSRTPALWRQREAVYELQTTVNSEFCRLLRSAPSLRTVTIKNSILPEEVIAEMLSGCALVSELRVAVAPRVGGSEMAAILKHYAPQLQELSLQLTTGDQAVWDAIASMEGLRVLRLSAGEPLPRDEPAGAEVGLQSLETLDLEALSGAERLPRYVEALLRARAGQLRHLALPKRSLMLSDAFLSELSPRWTQLESLSAGYDCVRLLGGLGRLMSLRLWYEYADPDEDCFAALRSTPLLIQHLTLEPDSRLKFIGAVLRACAGLRALQLHSDSISGRLPQILEHVPRMVTSLVLKCPRIQEQDVLSVPKYLPLLRRLELTECLERDALLQLSEKLKFDLFLCCNVVIKDG